MLILKNKCENLSKVSIKDKSNLIWNNFKVKHLKGGFCFDFFFGEGVDIFFYFTLYTILSALNTLIKKEHFFFFWKFCFCWKYWNKKFLFLPQTCKIQIEISQKVSKRTYICLCNFWVHIQFESNLKKNHCSISPNYKKEKHRIYIFI